MINIFIPLNNKLANGRVEIVVNDDNSLGFKLDGADTVFPFKGTIKLVADLIVSCTNHYNFGDSNSIRCTIIINNDSVSIKNNIVSYSAVGADKKTVDATAHLLNPTVVYV